MKSAEPADGGWTLSVELTSHRDFYLRGGKGIYTVTVKPIANAPTGASQFTGT